MASFPLAFDCGYLLPVAVQLRVYARLGVTTDSASRDAQLTLRNPEPVAPSADETD